MNRKLLCRIVTNAYNLVHSEVQVLDKEIELLRKKERANIDDLNTLMQIHEEIIQCQGEMSFERLYVHYEKLSNHCSLELALLDKIVRAYLKKDYILCTDLIFNNDKFNWKHILLLELIVNSIWQQQHGKMLIFRQSSFLYDDKISKVQIGILYEELEKDTEYYLEKKKIFTIQEIQDIMRIFLDKHKQEFNIHEVYLFGSYAKGLNDEYSDIDFLFVFNNSKNLDLIRPIIKDILQTQFEMSVDVVPAILGKLDEFDLNAKSYGIKLT